MEAGLQNVFVGRQPIMNRMLDVFGYELLFRDGDKSHANIVDGKLATSKVIRTAFIDMDLLQLTRGLKCFINVNRDFLLESEPFPFPTDQVVLEILEDELVDEQLIQVVTDMADTGLEFALDDYAGDERWDPLLDIVSYIKVDVLNITIEQLNAIVAKLKPYKAKILAEKVEAQSDLETCSELGFNLFQGYFFAKPEVVSGKTMEANQLQSLQLLAELQSPDVDIDKVQEIISLDVALSYGILRYINSAAFGFSDKVESIREAVNYIGLKPLTRWLTLLIITGTDNQNSELMSLAIIRARMCELLSSRAKNGDGGAFFTAGLFSMLEPIMQVPISEIIDKLPLTDELCAALISGEGPMGEAINCAHAYEECEWDQASFLHLEINDVIDVYTESVTWANEAMQML